MMATTQLKQIAGYIEPEWFERIERLREVDRRISNSWVVDRCIKAQLAALEKEILGKSHPSKPRQHSPK